MPNGSKVSLREWKDRLGTIIRQELGDTVPYDVEVAADYWRNGYGPREFFRENIVDPGDSEEIDLGREL